MKPIAKTSCIGMPSKIIACKNILINTAIPRTAAWHFAHGT